MSHSYETIDETGWENARGFEGSVTAMTAKISYNGRHGTTSTIRETQIVEDALTVSWPASTKRYLKYTAEKIDNFDVPFTAWVEKSTNSVGHWGHGTVPAEWNL